MKKIKVIMIDAFKPSYLKYTPYLKSLSEKNQHGELNMGLGHWRGVDVIFNGNSDIISNFYKNKNELRYLRNFLFVDNFGELRRFLKNFLFNFPRLLKCYEMFNVKNIPMKILYKLDVSVNKHVVKKKDIKFYYFGELDKLGHEYGPNSIKIIEAVKKIDEKISKMEFDIIFSDHGMVEINKVVEVPITNECFIDSDMARYWGKKEELEKIKNKLPLKEGKIIKWNKKYGDLIFLANTGVLIFPNFWNDKPVKGMHGYDGEDKEMKAFYLLDKTGENKNLKAEELHEILNEIRKRKQPS